MSNGLSTLNTHQIQPRYGWDEIRELAEQTARSGLFKMTAPQILVLMMIAESEGVHPIRALLMYDIIDGRPALKATTMAAKFQQAGGILEWLQTTNEVAEAVFTHPTSCPAGVRVRYTIDDAKLAGLTHKDNWRKDPGSMLVARCISRGVRRCLPGVIMGIYEPDEIPEAIPAEQQTTRTKLVDALKARRGPQGRVEVVEAVPTINGHDRPVVEVVDAQGEVIEPPTVQTPPRPLAGVGASIADLNAPPPAEPKPPRSAETEWGKFIASELEEWNIDRERMAEQHPELLGLRKHVTVNQVVNHLIKPDRESLKTDGKLDSAKVVGYMEELWTTDGEWVEDETRGYLSELIIKATEKKPAEPAAVTVG